MALLYGGAEARKPVSTVHTNLDINERQLGGLGLFSGLPQCKMADLMMANEAVAGRCSPRSYEEWQRPKPAVRTDRGSPRKWRRPRY